MIERLNINKWSVVFLVLFTFVTGGCGDKSEKIIGSIRASLPVGSTYADIESYLKKNNFEYSYDEKAKSFHAIVRDVKSDLFVSWSIAVIIKLDTNNKLSDLDVKLVGTGP